jgi:hypothetical protein
MKRRLVFSTSRARAARTWSAALLAAAGAVSASGLDPSGHRFERPVAVKTEAPGSSGDALVAIEVDPHLFAETVGGFADLRLVLERGEETLEWPYRIERLSPAPAPRELVSSATRAVSVETGEDGSLTMVLEAAERGFPADRVEIVTPLRDFEKTVAIAGSDDAETWEPLVAGALLVDQQRFVDFRRTSVELPRSGFRYYRLGIDEASDEQRSALREMTRTFHESAGAGMEERSRLERRDFRIDSVRLVRDPASPSPEAPPRTRRGYPAEILSISENLDDRITEILLATAGAPVDEITFATGDRNFRRTVEVEEPVATDDAGEVVRWRRVGQGAIHRYAIEGLAEERLSVSIDARRSPRLRLTVANLDSPPLAIEGISVSGPAYEIRFLTEAQPRDRWTLRYGGGTDGDSPPRYDLAALDRALAGGVASSSWALGEPVENAGYQARSTAGGWWEHPSAFLGIVALAVVVLVVLLVRVGRSVAAIEEGESDAG